MATKTNRKVDRSLLRLGDNLTRWRKIHNIPAAELALRAGVTRNTLRSIERGEGTAGLHNVVAVLNVLGLTDAVIEATEPLNTDVGRARADQGLPQRVRPRRDEAVE